jgi:hypothetical protein
MDVCDKELRSKDECRGLVHLQSGFRLGATCTADTTAINLE